MSDLGSIVLAARNLARQGEPFALATLVHVSGSSYRSPGARMVMTRDRWVAGGVSGGCLEGDVVRKAWWRTASGEPAVVTYDSSSDDDVGWGFGLGCNGVATILIERVTSAHDPLAFVARCIAREEPGALATVFRSARVAVPVGSRLSLSSSGGMASAVADDAVRERLLKAAAAVLAGGPTSLVDAGGVEALVESIAPPPHLFVFGSGHDALPVVQLAKAIGWRVTVVDRRARFATRERFGAADRIALERDPDAVRPEIDACHRPLAVVMSHDYDGDRDTLDALLRSRAEYIGILGPRRRTERMLSELAAAGRACATTERDRARLHAPVGLALGAETPEEIALAIVAEAQATATGTSAMPLRERATPIHAPFSLATRASSSGILDGHKGPSEVRSKIRGWHCAVLAAGASRRLGRPKQLLPFRGRPLIRHVVEQACAAGCEQVGVVVAGPGPIADALRGLPVVVLENAEWEEGIASSIRVATQWARGLGSGALALALADQPGLTARHLHRLSAEYTAGCRCVASAYADTVGVPALFDASFFDRLLTLEGDRGASRLLVEAGARAVPWSAGVIDVDTPLDIERLASFEEAGLAAGE